MKTTAMLSALFLARSASVSAFAPVTSRAFSRATAALMANPKGRLCGLVVVTLCFDFHGLLADIFSC